MKKKWIAFGIVAALLIAVLVIVLRFTKKQTKGIADGKYMVVDCPEYPDAYIIVKNNSIQIYNIDVNAIYRNEQVESIKKICEDKESGIVLTGEEIEKLSDLNKMFVENAYKVGMSEGRNINNGRAIQLRSFFILLILRCELRYLDYWGFSKRRDTDCKG